MPGAGFSTGRGSTIGTWPLLKDTTITERVGLQFRGEFFNIFNHAQFLTPSGITSFSDRSGDFGSFGQVPGTLPAAHRTGFAEIVFLAGTRREGRSVRRRATLGGRTGLVRAGPASRLFDEYSLARLQCSAAMGTHPCRPQAFLLQL